MRSPWGGAWDAVDNGIYWLETWIESNSVWDTLGNAIPEGTQVGSFVVAIGDYSLPRISVSDNSGLADDATIQFSTLLSAYRSGWAEGPLVRPVFPDTRHYVDVTNSSDSPLVLYETRINAPDVTADLMLSAASMDDITLAPGQSQRFLLTYAPSIPNRVNKTSQNFSILDGFVILSNAANASELNIALRGASTFDADITYDGRVNLSELSILNGNYGTTDADPDFDPTADITGDGKINLSELSVLNGQYGHELALVLLNETGGSTSVAEGGAIDTYSLVLSRQPTENVIVSVSPDVSVRYKHC